MTDLSASTPGRKRCNMEQLADLLAVEAGTSVRTARQLLQALVRVLPRELREGRVVSVKGFAIFERRIRKGRYYKHPLTGQSIEKPDTPTVVIRPSETFVRESFPAPRE